MLSRRAMARFRRKTVEVFSLSFLDCICCGFGAVLLLFVLTTGKKAKVIENELAYTEELISQAGATIQDPEKNIERLISTLDDQNNEIKSLNEEREDQLKSLVQQRELLARLALERSQLEDDLKRQKETQEALPKVPSKSPIPLPNRSKRQYLTNFKMGGPRVLFMVETSGGMLDETIDGAIARLAGSPSQKRSAPKWQRTLEAIKWLLASLDPEVNYQILTFGVETTKILPDPKDWLKASDTEATRQVLSHLKEIIPGGSANLERAFMSAQKLNPKADNIILITDGLPTQSNSLRVGNVIGERERIQMFKAAAEEIPYNTPINIILFPMKGDPTAAALFWKLAFRTKGSLVSPSKNWPDL